LNLCPEIEAEGKKWRFIGCQAKNRKEWFLTYLGGMFQNITLVAMYDTLSPEAMKFMVDQT